jgi:hypothetical protein
VTKDVKHPCSECGLNETGEGFDLCLFCEEKKETER